MSIASVADDDMNEKQIEAMLERFESIVMLGYDAPESEAIRAELREEIPTPPPELALALLPWVAALMNDLVGIAQGAGLLPPDDPNDGNVLTP